MKTRYMFIFYAPFREGSLKGAGIIACFLIFAVIMVSSLPGQAALRTGAALVLNTYCKRNGWR